MRDDEIATDRMVKHEVAREILKIEGEIHDELRLSMNVSGGWEMLMDHMVNRGFVRSKDDRSHRFDLHEFVVPQDEMPGDLKDRDVVGTTVIWSEEKVREVVREWWVQSVQFEVWESGKPFFESGDYAGPSPTGYCACCTALADLRDGGHRCELCGAMYCEACSEVVMDNATAPGGRNVEVCSKCAAPPQFGEGVVKPFEDFERLMFVWWNKEVTGQCDGLTTDEKDRIRTAKDQIQMLLDFNIDMM